MQRGDLIGLVDGHRPTLGVVLAVDGKRLTVAIGQAGKASKLPARDLVLLAALPQPCVSPPLRLSDAPWHLGEAHLAAALPRNRDIAAAWLLLSSTGDRLNLEAWTQLVAPEGGTAALAAAWLWLQGNQLWFTLRQGLISARPLHDLRLQRRQRRSTHLREASIERWHLLLRQRQPLTLSQLDERQHQDLELLRAWASGHNETPLPLPLQNGLRQAHCPLEASGIRQLLVDLGQWDAHALPALRLSPWAQGFSAELEALAAERLARIDQPHSGDERRVDRSGLHCVTIDDDDTEDIDDALSFELTGSGTPRIWIHVADPGRLIELDDPLDQEAQRRGASLYLARGIEPMFPWELSIKGLSLLAGKRCAAWSIWVELDAQGAVHRYGIERSWIRPTYRLSYSDADELIDLAPPQEAALLQLHGLLQRRRQWRESRGALLLDQPEGRIQVGEADGNNLNLRITEPSAARLLVAEAMILAGAVVAQHGASLQLPLPYRSQSPSAPTAEGLQLLPPGPVRHAALKQGLSRGLTGTTPASHFSLGLEAYVQATSPIRRYSDLLVQRQLARLWQEQAPMESAELQERLGRLEDPVRQGIQISRDDQRHWRQVWFQAHRQQQWRGEFLRWLRQSDRLGLIWLEALAMELPAQCPADCQPGCALLVKVHRVDPLQDCLQLRAHH